MVTTKCLFFVFIPHEKACYLYIVYNAWDETTARQTVRLIHFMERGAHKSSRPLLHEPTLHPLSRRLQGAGIECGRGFWLIVLAKIQSHPGSIGNLPFKMVTKSNQHIYI